jgi:hydroxypyruvate reductase
VDHALEHETGAVHAVVAAGKAATAMARAAFSRIEGPLREGVVAGIETAPIAFARGIPIAQIAGGHPLPTAASEEAARQILRVADAVQSDETLLVLVSGGASALVAAPAEGVTLEDKRAATNQLLKAGADIYALNTVRKHLSAIKGGWLAARTQGTCRTLVISDVVGDDLSVIASGPTVADASTFEDALDVMHHFGGLAAFPPAVVSRIQRGAARALPETPKPHDPRLARATTTTIGSRREAMLGAAAAAARLGYHVIRIDDAVTGEARATGPSHLRAVLARAAGSARPLCVVSSGETTVRVTGAGQGGRNQEFALAAAMSIGGAAHAAGGGHADTAVMLASVGTDGIDGPTDAAGALVDGSTVARAQAAGLVPDRFLSDNNAYAFFHALGDLIHTGPTGTNVGDLQVILLA